MFIKLLQNILRIQNWQNEKIFSSSSLGLIYTLAVLYLITSLIAIVKLGFILFARFAYSESFRLHHLLILLLFSFNFCK